MAMTDTIEDYALAYLKHQKILATAFESPKLAEKEETIMENIVQGAMCRFRLKRKEFEGVVDRVQKDVQESVSGFEEG